MLRSRSLLLAFLSLAGTAACARAAAAQADCRDGSISEVFIDAGDVFEVGSPELDARFNWAYRTANDLHLRTRESVIRRELLFHQGDCYRPALLQDTERILRSLSFIADADVFGVRQDDGSWHVVVETRDEWSTRLEPQVNGDDGLLGVELREDNVFGQGYSVSAWAKRSQGERIYGGSVGTRQLLGTHLDAELSVGRTPVGAAVTQRLAYPFRGESGRWAFREQVELVDRNFEFFVPGDDGSVQRTFFPEKRRSFDVGALTRVGPRGHLTIFGVALTGEWTEYPRETLTSDGGGDDDPVGVFAIPEVSPPVTGLDTLSVVRAVFLAGQRNVRFVRRSGLDAVRGVEDVRLGVEAEVSVGKSIPALSSDDDLALGLGLAASGYVRRSVLAGARATFEARHDSGTEADPAEWRDLFGQLDGWAYWRPDEASRHTFVGAVSAVGGWRTRVPFQLTLGQRAGLRGLPRHAYPGERRVVGTLEHRAYLGWPYPRLFDLGSAAFVDVGKMWVGGDPFGMNSPVAVSAGVGLRAAFPPGSRRTYRLDVAYPVSGGISGRSLTVTFGIGQAIGRDEAGEDAQLRRSSRRPLSAGLFNFPD